MKPQTQGLLVVGVIGLGTLGILLWSNLSRPEYEDGVQLSEGWNEVAYLGKDCRPEVAFGSIYLKVIIVWHYDAATKEWLFWDPKDTMGSDLKFIRYSDALRVHVDRDCYWAFPQ